MPALYSSHDQPGQQTPRKGEEECIVLIRRTSPRVLWAGVDRGVVFCLLSSMKSCTVFHESSLIRGMVQLIVLNFQIDNFVVVVSF